MTKRPDEIQLASPDWGDYALLDSGGGLKLERFGAVITVRPEPGALWRPALPESRWKAADARFVVDEKSGSGRWQHKNQLPPRWQMNYKPLHFWAELTPFRHLGVFPEQAAHWDWMAQKIGAANRPVRVLSLFGYTGLASLMAAAAGASVTHVDAAKKAVAWARENQALSNLEDRPIRWIVDDALKFVEREVRRKSFYDAFVMDPPPFGHGPKGEVWKFDKSLPVLLDACRKILSDSPLFVVITAYTAKTSIPALRRDLQTMIRDHNGDVSAGETVLVESSAKRVIPTAIFARWSAS